MEEKIHRKYSIEHLELGSPGTYVYKYRITDIQVQHWNELFDLSALQTLTFTALVLESGLDEFLSLSFPALTSITFRCMDEPSACYFDKVKRFIRGLSRLESLYILGWDWFVASLAGPDTRNGYGTPPDHPSRTLQTLWLEHRTDLPSFTSRWEKTRSYILSASEITRLGAFYPLVKDLCIIIRRSKGDSDEVARYKALGASFPHLKRLVLTLDASPPHISLGNDGIFILQPKSTQFEDQYSPVVLYTNGDCMYVMVNSALDAKLARQIFAAIASQSLETMMVRVKGGMEFVVHPCIPLRLQPRSNTPGLALRPWLNGLAREWIVDTINSKGEVKVREIGRNAEGWKGEARDPLKVHYMDPFMKHFRTLWPDSKMGG